MSKSRADDLARLNAIHERLIRSQTEWGFIAHGDMPWLVEQLREAYEREEALRGAVASPVIGHYEGITSGIPDLVIDDKGAS